MRQVNQRKCKAPQNNLTLLPAYSKISAIRKSHQRSAALIMMGQVRAPKLLRKPFRVYKREQARISRHTLYPVTAIYTLYSVTMLVVGFRSGRPLAAFAFYLAGIPVWTLF